MTISQAVITLRLRLLATQDLFSTKIGIAQPTLARIETGIAPGPRTLGRLADIARSHRQFDLAEFFDNELLNKHGLITPGRLETATADRSAVETRGTR